MLCLLHFIGSSGYANAPNRSGIRTLSVLFILSHKYTVMLATGPWSVWICMHPHVCYVPHHTRPFSLGKPNNILFVENTSLHNSASYFYFLPSFLPSYLSHIIFGIVFLHTYNKLLLLLLCILSFHRAFFRLFNYTHRHMHIYII